MSQTIEVVPFAGDLRSHGDRLAVVAPDGGELTYRELAERVSDACLSAMMSPSPMCYSELLLVLPALPVAVITLAVGIVAWRVAERTWRSFQRVRCGSRQPDAYTAI
jgi:hypothetical protein